MHFNAPQSRSEVPYVAYTNKSINTRNDSARVKLDSMGSIDIKTVQAIR